MKKILFLLIPVLLFSCSQDNDDDTNYQTYFVGSWKMIEEYENDVLLEQEEGDCGYLGVSVFFADGTIEDERYEYNVNTSTCYLEGIYDGNYTINEEYITIEFLGSTEIINRQYEIINDNQFQILSTDEFQGNTYHYRTVLERQ